MTVPEMKEFFEKEYGIHCRDFSAFPKRQKKITSPIRHLLLADTGVEARTGLPASGV
jgi:hypothetical protein